MHMACVRHVELIELTTSTAHSLVPHSRSWLLKRGQKRKNWKKRWHILDPTQRSLSYSEAPGAEPIDTVQLSNARVLSECECETQIGVKECFAVAAADRTLYLREVCHQRVSPACVRALVPVCLCMCVRACVCARCISTHPTHGHVQFHLYGHLCLPLLAKCGPISTLCVDKST
jgi:hypothetical protein